MKIIIITTLLLSAFLGSSGQTCVLTGKVPAPRQRFIVLKYETKSGLEFHADTIRLDVDDRFRYTWKFDPPYGSAKLDIDPKLKLYIWAHDKGELDMQIGDSAKNTVFSGNLASYNRYMNIGNVEQWRAVEKKYYAHFASGKNEQEYGSDDYYNTEDSVLSERIQHLTGHFSSDTNPDSKLFVRFFTNRTLYANYNEKLTNGVPNAVMKFRPLQKLFNKNLPTYILPAEMDFTDTLLLRSGDFRYFLRTLLFTSTFARKEETAKDVQWDWDSVYNNVFKMTDYLTTPGTLQNSLLKAVFMDIEIELISSTPYKEDTTAAIFTKYVQRLLNDPLIPGQAMLVNKNLVQQLNRLGKLKKGNIAPLCKFADEKGEIVDWTNFKGKYIYVDVWASWCGPCVAEIPYWNALVEKYKDNKNIAFVTVSIDENTAAWKKAVLKYMPAGVHLISPGGFKSDFSKLFNIKSVPANILIDPEGKMLQQIAPRAKNISLGQIINR